MKPEKTFYAIYKLVKNWIIRFFILIFIFSSISHFSENQSGLSIVILLCVIVFAVINDEQICIYKSHFEINKLFLGGLYSMRVKYDYKNIKSIKIEDDLIIEGNSFNETISDRHFQNVKSEIVITDNDDKSITIKSSVSKMQLRIAIELINNNII